MSFQYHTCCVKSTAEAIDAMVDAAKKITYRTMLINCPDLLDWAESMGYVRDGRERDLQGRRVLTLLKDWYVHYYYSQYRGRPCYYLVHSAIEYIFVQENT